VASAPRWHVNSRLPATTSWSPPVPSTPAARWVAEIVAAGGSAEFQPCDVTDARSVAAVAAHLGDRPLHVLVNNAAAFADWGEVPSTADLDVTATVLDTNVLGPWRVVQALLPALRRAGHARIVNVGSGAGSHGEPRFGLATGPAAPSYAVSKAALHALSVKFAQELRETGILVNVVDPGLTATAAGMEAMGARPVGDGAASIVRTALGPDDGTSGGFFRDGEALPW